MFSEEKEYRLDEADMEPTDDVVEEDEEDDEKDDLDDTDDEEDEEEEPVE